MSLKCKLSLLTCGLLVVAGIRESAAQSKLPEPADLTPLKALRPDDPQAPSGMLGPVFESISAGIKFRGLPGINPVRRIGGDEFVQFNDEQKHWTLTVSRIVPSKPVPLTTEPDKIAKDGMGMLETTIERLKVQTPGVEVLRQDTINVRGNPVGMIVARYKLGLDAHLFQQAIFRADAEPTSKISKPSGLYYVFNLVVPAPKTGDMENDPDIRAAVNTFTQMLDSVTLVDQTAIKDDQVDRLYRTRALFVSMNEPRLRQILMKEQWLRIIRDGKDIGYSYIVEEVGHDLPRYGKTERIAAEGGAEGVVIGVRSRTYPEPNTHIDAESWSFTPFNRKSEAWAGFAINYDANGKKTMVSEAGSSLERDKAVADPTNTDKRNPGVALTTEAALQVKTIASDPTAEPIKRPLPVWYTQQAISHLIPRICARNGQNRTYMFATYISELHEVMNRYVDVLSEKQVVLAGKTVQAVPVEDRVGLEGSVTTHYFTRDGVYLGSQNPTSKLTLLPTDAPTLTSLWKDAELSRPKEVGAQPQ